MVLGCVHPLRRLAQDHRPCPSRLPRRHPLVSLHHSLRPTPFLLGEGAFDRKQWLEHRVQELAQIFAVSVAGFTMMDNHLHLLVRLDPNTATAWSDEQVVCRWGRLFPPRDQKRRPLPVSDQWVQD